VFCAVPRRGHAGPPLERSIRLERRPGGAGGCARTRSRPPRLPCVISSRRAAGRADGPERGPCRTGRRPGARSVSHGPRPPHPCVLASATATVRRPVADGLGSGPPCGVELRLPVVVRRVRAAGRRISAGKGAGRRISRARWPPSCSWLVGRRASPAAPPSPPLLTHGQAVAMPLTAAAHLRSEPSWGSAQRRRAGRHLTLAGGPLNLASRPTSARRGPCRRPRPVGRTEQRR
jgi:hypothetical protein